MGLKLFNTLTGRKEIFKPISKREVRMYVCGPTVNDVPHLGHARQQITFDILRKYLKFIGMEVKFVSNITDIEDKIIDKAKELGEEIEELVKRNTKAHLEDYARIGVSPPDVQPRATKYIEEMIELIKMLEKKGVSYVIDEDGVYFDVSKFKEYGKLSKQNLKKLKSGARIAVKDSKRNKEDFVLWKFSKVGEPSWKSPWGGGRPGWHIECSAMSHAILGNPFDIHGGGQDLMFPHHEDEIAQSELAYGRKMCNFWVHNGMVNVEKIKMSKSLGNFKTIREILNNYEGNVIRYFVMSTHYRKPIDFSINGLDAAKNGIDRLKRKIAEIKKESRKGKDLSERYEKQFADAMNDDLNCARALEVLWSAVDDFDFSPKEKIKFLEKIDSVLWLGVKGFREEKIEIPEYITKLVEERERMRREKKWGDADRVREEIRSKGFEIEDSSQGSIIKKI